MAELVEGVAIPLDKGPMGLEMTPYAPEDMESPEDSLSNESVNPSPTESQMASPGVVSHPIESVVSMPAEEPVMIAVKPELQDEQPEETILPAGSPTRIIGGSRHRVPGKFKCTQCDSTFSKPARLAQHMQTHSDERPFVCTWEGCSNAFKRKTHLNRHMMLHNQEFPFKCDWPSCTRAFVQKCQLEKHVIIHTTPKPYTCPWEGCGEAFSKHNKLRRHLCSHTGESPYPCTTEGCEQGFDHPSHLARHIRCVHNKTKSNLCPEPDCGESFFTFNELRKHMSKEHPREYSCEVCGRNFSVASRFKDHLKKHELVREVYPCELCEKEFSTKANLNTHIRVIHENQKPFICTIDDCTEAFAYKHCLQRHLRNIHKRSKTDVESIAPNAKRPKLGENFDEDTASNSQTDEQEQMEESL